MTLVAGYGGLCYAMARDRLFQMDVLRRSAEGRLAEIYGPGDGDGILRQDLLVRAQNLSAFAAARYAAAAPRTKRILQGCAAGVNQYITDAKASSSGLPLEFQVLGYQPAPWTPEDSVLAYIYVGVTFDTLTWFTKLERAAVASIAGTEVATTLIKEGPILNLWNLVPLDGSLGVMTTGFNGDPRTCRYADHAEAWRAGQIFPIPFTAAAIP